MREGGQIGELGEASIESGDVRTIHLPAAVEYCESLCQCIIDVPWRSQSQHSQHPTLVRRPFCEGHMPHNQQRSRVSWRLSRQLSRESIFRCRSFLLRMMYVHGPQTCLTTDLISITDPRTFEQAEIATIRVFFVISGKRLLMS